MPAIAHSAIESILDRPHGEHTSASRTCCLTTTLDMLSMIVGYDRQMWISKGKVQNSLWLIPIAYCTRMRPCMPGTQEMPASALLDNDLSISFKHARINSMLKWLEPDESLSEFLFVLFQAWQNLTTTEAGFGRGKGHSFAPCRRDLGLWSWLWRPQTEMNMLVWWTGTCAVSYRELCYCRTKACQ